MEILTSLNKSSFEGIKPGQTKAFQLADRSCLNRCRAMVHFANYNWLRPEVEKFTTSWDSSSCILMVTAVRS